MQDSTLSTNNTAPIIKYENGNFSIQVSKEYFLSEHPISLEILTALEGAQHDERFYPNIVTYINSLLEKKDALTGEDFSTKIKPIIEKIPELLNATDNSLLSPLLCAFKLYTETARRFQLNKVIDYIIAHEKIDWNKKFGNKNQTSLMFALQENCSHTFLDDRFKTILKNPNLDLKVTDNDGHSIAYYIGKFDHADLVSEFIQLIKGKYKNDQKEITNQLSEALRGFVECQCTNKDTINLLLEKGADPTLCDMKGKDAIYLAYNARITQARDMGWDQDPGFVYSLTSLLNHLKGKTECLNQKYDAEALIMHIFKADSYSIVKQLLEKGADIYITDKNNLSLLTLIDQKIQSLTKKLSSGRKSNHTEFYSRQLKELHTLHDTFEKHINIPYIVDALLDERDYVKNPDGSFNFEIMKPWRDHKTAIMNEFVMRLEGSDKTAMAKLKEMKSNKNILFYAFMKSQTLLFPLKDLKTPYKLLTAGPSPAKHADQLDALIEKYFPDNSEQPNSAINKTENNSFLADAMSEFLRKTDNTNQNNNNPTRLPPKNYNDDTTNTELRSFDPSATSKT